MGYCRPMGYGPQFSANQLGRELKLWGKRGYGLRQVWVKRGLTVSKKQIREEVEDLLDQVSQGEEYEEEGE